MSDLRMLILGSCNLRTPLYRAAHAWPRDAGDAWRHVPDNLSIAGPMFAHFTIGEMIQTARCYRGLDSIPPYIQPLCHIETPEWAPTTASSPLDRIDMAIIEPTTSMEILFDGYIVNRGPVLELLDRLAVEDPAVRALRFKWYHKGVVALDETVKRAFADELAPLIPTDYPQRTLIIDLLRRSQGLKHDMRAGLAMLSSLLEVPIGVAAYTWRYMADGRHITWPAGFHEEVVGSATSLALPVFEPRPLIDEVGLANALDNDLSHYADAFMPIVAKALIAFSRSVVSAAAPGQPAVDFSDGSISPSRARAGLAEQVNGALVELHRERLEALGLERSGLYDAYAALLRVGVLIGDQERAALEAVAAFLPAYDGYATMRAGLGELPLLIAASGRSAIAYEDNANRRAAIEAGFERLATLGLAAPGSLRVEDTRIPTGAPAGRILGIASKLGLVPAQQVEWFADRVAALEAVLIDPRWLRVAGESDGEGRIAQALRERGLVLRRDYPAQRLSWITRA